MAILPGMWMAAVRLGSAGRLDRRMAWGDALGVTILG